MTGLIWCEHGHQYVAAEHYVDWPQGFPKCPICRKEWARKKALNWRAIELLSGLRPAIKNLSNQAERHDFVLEANEIIKTMDIECFYEFGNDGKLYLIHEGTGLRIGTED